MNADDGQQRGRLHILEGDFLSSTVALLRYLEGQPDPDDQYLDDLRHRQLAAWRAYRDAVDAASTTM